MNNYKAVIQYEGTRYDGWQKQGNTANTIQGKLEGVLEKMTGRAVEVFGSGRTDAGVHATGQVANFRIHTTLQPQDIQRYLNQYLPADIGVLSVEIAPERFHSRLNATSKRYIYRIWNSDLPNVFKRRLMLHYPQTLDVEAMRRAAGYLVGKHDYKAFCSLKKVKKSTVRTLHSIEINTNGEEIQMVFDGNGFLYNMVRILAGTIMEVGESKRESEEIPMILDSGDRQLAGATAPAHGLTLAEVRY